LVAYKYKGSMPQGTSINLRSGTIAISAYAFQGCSGLSSISIPNSVTTIGTYAFSGCSGLTSITIPNSVTTIGQHAFVDTPWYNNQSDGLVYAGLVAYKYKGSMPQGTIINLRSGTIAISEYAFSGCSGLTGITIPNSVTTIGNSAFSSCSGLTSITIPNSVTTIGDLAFQQCSRLTSVNLPNSITTIRPGSFSSCSVLKSIVIPNSVTTIDASAFRFCRGLTTITIPNSVTSIGAKAFQDCTSLDSLFFDAISCNDLFFPVKDNPFYNLNISTIVIGDNVQKIPANFASRLSNLTNLIIGNSVSKIGSSAFSSCNGLTSVTIPNSVTSIGIYALQFCPGLTSITVANDNSNYDSRNNCNAIIETVSNTLIVGCQNTDIPNSVKTIGNFAFYNCIGLTSITIPNSVNTIGNYAFYTYELKNVKCLATTPPSISNDSFYSYSNTTLTVPRNCYSLYRAAEYWNEFSTIIEIPYDFEINGIYYAISGSNTVMVTYRDTGYNSYSGNVIIPSSITYNNEAYAVTAIGNNAFYNCSGLTSITIPNSVTTIGSSAFYGCTGLTYVKIPESVTSIGNYAFQGCSALETLNFNAVSCADFSSTANYRPFYNLNISTIIIGNSVQRIPAYFAHGLTGLTSLSFGNAVTTIGNSAFNNCSGLTSVDIPNSVTTIENSAFYNCFGLTSVNLPNSVTAIGNSTFYNCSGLTSITIPNSVTAIGSSAFYGCTGLTYINIPESVTSIGNYVFQGCTAIETLNFNAVSCADFSSTASYRPFYNLNISTINIGNSVQRIPAYFAYGLTGLTSLTFGNAVTTIGNYAFSNCTGLTKVNISDIAAWCNITFGNSGANPLSVAKHLYLNGSEITNLTIPNTVTSINSYAFYNDLGLETVTIPNTVSSISQYAFNGCSALSKVDITDIAAWCNISFENNTANPLCYAHHLYLNDSEVTDLIIPETITSISNYAFYGGSGLVSATIPNSVTTIGNYAFQGCSALDTLYYNAVNCADFSSTASYRPFYNLNFSTIKIGDNVEKIPAYFAYGMSNLTDITIPKSVTTIGGYAFNGCTGLTGALTIPKNVTYVGDQAFNNVPSLEVVTCAAETPPTWNDIAMFTTNVYNHTPLYVPIGSERAYMADQSWGQFVTIIGIDIPDEVLATEISLNHSQMSLQVGSSSQLIATVLPDSATNKVVTWISSNPDIATVDNTGLVTAVASGKATITATTVDGSNLSASCNVTVTEDLSNYDNYLSMSDTAAFHGDTIVIPVKMTNEASIISFQTDIFLPEGLELLQEDGEYVIDPSERMTRTHSIMSNDVSNGAIRVLCYSSNYKPFTGNSGDDLFYITVKVADDAEGDYTILLKNTLLTNTDFADVAAPDVAANVNVKAYLLGDANNSGSVTITDVVVTAQYVLELNPQPFVFEAADANVDGSITVADVSRIAWMVLNPTLNAPLRAPALWNNGDRMSAEDITLAAGETRRVSILLDNEMDYNAFQLDLNLPEGLTASNFQVTDRADSHAFDVNTLQNGNIRALCYSPALTVIDGHEGTLLTFDVTASAPVTGDITIDGIELVTADCQSVKLDAFTIGVNNESSISESISGKAIDKIEYFNLAGQRMEQPSTGVTLVVTTYTDGSRTTAKVFN